MRLNRVERLRQNAPRTHEGGIAVSMTPEMQLERAVQACMLWEDTFYESGVTIADRIRMLVPQVPTQFLSELAVRARTEMKLRHVPLLLVREMARGKHRTDVAKTLADVIQRADELAEFLALYWETNDKKRTVSAQVKKGLAAAFQKFDAYQLAKYDRPGPVRLRDVLFLCHAKPKDIEQRIVWTKLIDGALESPDTWEVALSAGKGKKETFERLLREKNLLSLALLRNLRNMLEAGVDRSLIKSALSEMDGRRVLPFRYVSAAEHATQLEPWLEPKFLESARSIGMLHGRTVLLVDTSGSMNDSLSARSEMTRWKAAAALAAVAREVCDDLRVFVFATSCHEVAPRRGFALVDAIMRAPSGGTNLANALSHVAMMAPYDRIIVITDEQAHDDVGGPSGRGYMINVGSYENGVGYGPWTRITGWSEAVVNYIVASEAGESKVN